MNDRQVYNSARWRNLRKQVLTAEPYCHLCKASDLLTLATDIDHIIPISKGGAVWDRSNLQPLCHACHSSKTAREQESLFTQKHDTQIILVCGPPGAGKTTLVRDRIQHGDAAIDIDALAAALTLDNSRRRHKSILSLTLAIIPSIIREAIGRVPRLWIITQGATEADRLKALHGHQPHEIIMLRPNKSIVKARIQQDDTREAKEDWFRLVDEWYQANAADETNN